jgi:1,4-alpha-glucan branching enzyme
MAEQRMTELAEKFSKEITKPAENNIRLHALNQAARELVLAESSDWAFIMKTGTMVPYAHKRTKLHINRFTKIYNDLLSGSIDREWLKEVEGRDNIFSGMDCASYYLPGSPRVAKKEKSYASAGYMRK